MSKDQPEVTVRIADALERIADSIASLEALFIEREKKFAAKASRDFGDKPRSFGPKRDFGDKPRSFGPKRDFGGRSDDRGDRPTYKKRDDEGNDNFDEFKKRGPRSTFRDFDAPKNRKPAGDRPYTPRGDKPSFAGKKPAGGGFKGKKKF